MECVEREIERVFREGEGGGGGGRSVTSAGGGGGGGGGRRAPSLRLVNGRATTGVSLHTSSTESVRSPHHHLGQQQGGNNNNNNNNNNHNNNNNNNNCHAGNNPAANNHPRLNKDDSIKISIENTNTCTDSLVTALDDETLLITDFAADTGESGRLVHFNYRCTMYPVAYVRLFKRMVQYQFHFLHFGVNFR